MRSILIKALVGLSLLVTSGVAHAQPSTGTLDGPVLVVPTVTADAYTIGSTAGQQDFGDAVILTNTGDTDADTWTLPDCDSAISGTAPYAPKLSTIGLRVNVLNNVAVANAIILDPIATDQIAGTSAVNVNFTSSGKGSFVSLVCAADDLWVPMNNVGFVGDTPSASNQATVAAFTDLVVTTTATLTVAQLAASGGVVTNRGDADGATATLPDCEAAQIGLKVTAVAVAAQTFNIDVGADDLFTGGIETTDAAGDKINNATTPVAGDSITVVCSAADVWLAVQESTADWADAN